ncbi:MAG: IS1595 family transposase [Paracoccaceae bacterium]|nr:IS1595 family transposase [Paracoccaceae bacterium]
MKAPGKSYRKGISIFELSEMFPTEESAVKWFEEMLWPNGRKCGHCGSEETSLAKHEKMPYWCKSCRSFFSVRTGTVLANSRLPLRKWVFALYLFTTNLKGVSSMRLHRELGITQKTAWFMLHRLRESWKVSGLDEKLKGPVEVDETYMGGKESGKHKSKKLNKGRGPVGKTAVIGIKDRDTNMVVAKVVADVKKPTLQGYIHENVNPEADKFTDNNTAYSGLEKRQSVNHSIGEYVRGKVHTNGIESFWAMFKRAHKGTYHKMSPKHLQRYVDEFVGRHYSRPSNTIDQMGGIVKMAVGKKLAYGDLVADNGLDSGARAS